MTADRICRASSCTDERACAGGCWWVRIDLCSTCFERDIEAVTTAIADWATAHLWPREPVKLELAGRPITVRCDGREAAVAVIDHLGLPIAWTDPDDAFLMPHYSAAELMPIFGGAQ